MNILKGKYGVYIALCTLIIVVGIILMESDNIYAEQSNYIWLNKTDLSSVSSNTVKSDGSLLWTWHRVNDDKEWAIACNNYDVKCAGYIDGNVRKYVFAISSDIFNNIDSSQVIIICQLAGITTSEGRNGFFTNYSNIYYYTQEVDISRYPIFTYHIPYYNSLNECLTALDDGIDAPLPPHDPEYSYSSDLGSLQNVYFRQVYDTVNNESIIDITYDQYTSTGIDLSQNGYGIATQVIKKDLSSQKVQISNTIERAWDNTKKTILKIFTNYINEWGINLNIPGGGGHSFSFDDEEPANALTKYDILLRPYYYDGSDYSYGDTTIIEDVDINKIGTRMMKNADTTINDDPVDINFTKVKITNYDFTWNSSNISYNEYMNYNIMNEETVYNYTLYSDDSTEINNIGYSTTNIYNYDGDNPSFTFNDFNITQQDVINTVKSFKDVWSAIIYFVPHVLGLFAYLPTWSLVLVSGCFIILAGVCVVKFVAPLL